MKRERAPKEKEIRKEGKRLKTSYYCRSHTVPCGLLWHARGRGRETETEGDGRIRLHACLILSLETEPFPPSIAML